MKILIFSWRDIKNPKSGGAEILTLELAKRWVKKGHQVSILSARFPKSKDQEEIAGVKIFRPAPFYQYSPFSYFTYIIKKIKFYKQNLEGSYDLIIDQVHGLPFFTPFFVKEKVVLFPLEVAKQIWYHEISFPFSFFGYFLEFLYIKLFKNHPFLVISSSTASELTQMGVKKVSVITCGISFKPLKKVPKKSLTSTLVILGRITNMKRLEQALLAFQLISKTQLKAKLLIIGKGQEKYINKLKKLCQKLKISDKTFFTGFVSEEKKFALLSKAWILISTSVREGWGLNIIEAAACGTPSVVYQVPGLIDSVKDQESGLICKKNTPEELAKEIKKLLDNHQLRSQLSQNALSYSRKFSWDKAAKKVLEILEKIATETSTNSQVSS